MVPGRDHINLSREPAMKHSAPMHPSPSSYNRSPVAGLFALPGIVALLLAAATVQAQPTSWQTVGPGGGGALFLPSLGIANSHELTIACDMSQLFRSTDLGETWGQTDFRQIQTSGSLGRVQFTNDPATQYALTNMAEAPRAVKSTDGGATWQTLANDPVVGEAFNLIADPNNKNRLLLSSYNALYISTDGGASFAQRYSTASGNGLHLGGAFFDGASIYVGTNAGLLVSSNNGASFAVASIGGIPSTEAIVSMAGGHQGNTTRLVAVTLGSADVYAGITGADHSSYRNVYTLDAGGASWVARGAGITAGVHPFFAGMSLANTANIYVAGGSDQNAPTVYRSTDGGATWQNVLRTQGNQNVATGWSGSQGDRDWSYGEYALGFAVSPVDPNIAVITDLGYAHVTADGGNSWRQAYVRKSDENPANAPTPKGKAYHSIGLENTTAWQVAWADSTHLIGCYSDIRGTISTDAGATWGFGYTGHTMNSMYRVARHPANGRLYAATGSVHDMYQSTTLTDARIDGGRGQVLTSADHGATWTLLHDFQHPVIWVALDPANPNRLYASVIHSTAGGIYVSSDIQNGAASQWTRLAAPPRTEGHPFNVHVLNDGTLLCTYSGRRTSSFTASSGVFISTNGGTSWTDRSAPQMQYWTKDVVIDPHDASQNTWYVGVFSGWGGPANGLGGLYRTTNRGTSWTKVFDNDRVTSCAINPTNRDEMYVTTEIDGLWHASNATAASPQFTSVASYPFRQPERVFFNPYNPADVWVTSFGNGLRHGGTLATPPPAVPLRIAPANDSANVPLAPTFVWNQAEGAATYHVQLSTAPTFATTVLDSAGVATTSLAATGLAPNTKYYWRIAADGPGGNSGWTAAWAFTTLAVPGAPALASPADNATGVAPTGTVQWIGVPGAGTYNVQIATAPAFATTVANAQGISGTEYPFALALNTTYYWRVQAVNGASNGPWSAPWAFTTAGFSGVAGGGSQSAATLRLEPNTAGASQTNAFAIVTVGTEARVTVRVVGLDGRTAAVLADGRLGAGAHRLLIPIQELAAGHYFVVMTGDARTTAQPLTVVR